MRQRKKSRRRPTDSSFFTLFRKSIKKDLGAENVRAEGEALIQALHEAALTLSPEGSSIDVSSGSSSGGAVATFIGSLAIIVREGLEAILIVGAIIAYLVKSGNKKGVIPVYVGSVFAIVCSFAMAGLLNYLKAINPETTMSQEVIDGVAALLAVAVLFYVSNWMVSKSESAAWTSYIKGKAEGGVFDGMPFMFAASGIIASIPYNDVLDVFGIYPLAGTIIPQIILAIILIITFVVANRRNARLRAQVEAEAAGATDVGAES